MCKQKHIHTLHLFIKVFNFFPLSNIRYLLFTILTINQRIYSTRFITQVHITALRPQLMPFFTTSLPNTLIFIRLHDTGVHVSCSSLHSGVQHASMTHCLVHQRPNKLKTLKQATVDVRFLCCFRCSMETSR